jgi:hypothetical protein
MSRVDVEEIFEEAERYLGLLYSGESGWIVEYCVGVVVDD